MKLNFLKFMYSGNRVVYIRLALKYRVAPWRVYSLAHGGRSNNRRENKILKELQKLHIISDVKSW